MVDPKSLSNEEALKQAGIDHILMHGSAFHALANDTGKKILVEGKGIMVKDIDGEEYIDALAGLWLVNVGHGRQEIGDAMARQAGTLAYASSTQATTIPAIELATRLAAITPGDQTTAFLFRRFGIRRIRNEDRAAIPLSQRPTKTPEGHRTARLVSRWHLCRDERQRYPAGQRSIP